MSCSPSRIFVRISLGFSLAIGVAAIGRSEDKAQAAAPVPAPAENSIATAKRDFEAIKAARDPVLQQKSDLPRLGIPEMRGGAQEPSPWSAARAPLEGTKSSNWLVDAMEKSSENKKDRDRERTERDGTPRSRETRLDERFGQRSGADNNENDTERKLAGPTPNPFARYLDTWMTPQDYALLKPGLEKPIGTQIDSRSSAPTSSAPTAAGLLAGGNLSPNGARTVGSTPSRISSPPLENPYLPMLNAPSPVAAVVPWPAAAVGLPPVGTIQIQSGPVQPAEPKSIVPDFAKPTTNEKHFKQLKRF